MSKLCLVVVLILMAGRIYAQKYFVLIEADNGQPFYVRVDSQYYSSSARGHLILSQLKDSSYTITIGFPGQVFPERQFFFSVHQNDHAFRLKNEEGRGWWLVDDKGQELATLNANSGGASVRIPGIKKDDAFSRLMADVVKDTAVMYTTFTIEQSTPATAVGASITAASTTPASTTLKPANAAPTNTSLTNAASANAAPANAAPARDSQALTMSRPADTTASVGQVTRDSAAMVVTHPAHDSSAFRAFANSAAADSATAARSVAKPVDSAVVTRPGTVSTVDSTTAIHQTRDSSLTVHPSVATPVDSGVTRSAVVPASDSSVAAHPANTPLYRPIPRKDTATAAAPLASASTPPASTPIPLPSAAAPLYRTTGVTMLTEHQSSRSLRQVYTDHDSNGKADTVIIIIPLDTPAQGRPIATSAPRVVHPASADSSHLTAPQGPGPNSDTPALNSVRTPAKSTLPFVNSDCHNFATDYDVDKLRVKMLESAKDDDRILAARKVFKTKCFSTHQIRALIEVFTTDAAKFKFLEAAYPFVSDDHFAELSNQLADPVYSGRFRAMTGHP